MIIDAHIHMFRPDQMPSADPDYLSKLPVYLRLLFTPTKYNHTRQGWATCDRMIEIMDEEGVDRVCVLGPEDDYTARCYNQYPDRLLPFKYLDMPALRRNRKEELLRMRRFIEEEGFVGFGEHHPDLNGNELSNPNVLAVMDLACELGVPVNFHVSEPVGHFYYGKSHNPVEEYFWLIARYPELKLVMSHWGGGISFYETIPGMRPFLKNVYYDVAASRLFYDIRKSMEQITRMVDTRKLFYGSDFPLLLQPREYPDELNPRFLHDRCDFLQSCVPSEVLDGIMGLNFADFLGIKEPRSSAIPPVKPDLRRYPSPVVPNRPYFAESKVTADSSVWLVGMQFPAAREIFDRAGIPWNDVRVNPWLALIQPLAQAGIWFEDGFMDDLRAVLPPAMGCAAFHLDLGHEGIRKLSAPTPAPAPSSKANRSIIPTSRFRPGRRSSRPPPPAASGPPIPCSNNSTPPSHDHRRTYQSRHPGGRV